MINKKHQAMLKNWQNYIYLLIMLLALSITALTKIPFSDNAKSFYQVPQHLFENENKVKSMLGTKARQSIFIVKSRYSTSST